jgi:putative peptidoglycan lipid II flippase
MLGVTAMSKGNKEIVKSSIAVSLIAGLGLILGVLSQVLIAYYFGTSGELDRFLVAYAFPSLFIGMSGAVFSSSLIPVVTPIKDSREQLGKAIFTAFFFVLVISISTTLLGFFGRAFLLRTTTNYSQEDLDQTIRLASMVWPLLGLTLLVSFVSSVYQLSKSFIWPAVVALLPTVGKIAGTIFLAKRLGIAGLIGGEVIFCCLSFVVLLPIILRLVPGRPRIEFRNTYALQFLKTLIPVSISLAAFTILPSIDVFWASKLPAGSISYIGYSTRIVVALGSLVVGGIYVVIFPYLSEDFSNNEKDVFLSRMGTFIKAVSIFFIPMATFCTFYRYELLDALLKRGMFTAESIKGVASVLPFYLIGLVAMGPTTLVSRAYYAKKESVKFGILSLLLIMIYFVLVGVLSRYLSYVGIGVAYLIFWLLLFIVSTLFLDKGIFSSDFFSHILKVALSVFGGVAASYVVVRQLAFSFVAINLIIGFVTTCLAFGFLCYVSKIEQAISLGRYIYDRTYNWVIGLCRGIKLRSRFHK